MSKKLFILILITTISISIGLAHFSPLMAQTKSELIATKQILKNLGNYHHPVSTNNPTAQSYFDRGLIYAYGFNHAEAARSFQQATKYDPNCAMCYWGIALVLGPNINAPMEADNLPKTHQALQKAIALSENASESEQAYIEALTKRYPQQWVENRQPQNLAYANAMKEVANRYPDDLDAATLFAEALMDTTPWDYWDENGNPKPEGKKIMATLESVLKRNPNHPGANHLYIHAVEKEHPELAVASADRLLNLVPASGHLVHMASHIYIRVGRYHDAIVSNQKGIQADNTYVANTNNVSGIYPLAYMPHNHHFLWFGALMTGQSKLALQAANHTAKVDAQLMRSPDFAGALQHYYAIPFYTLTRFGKWNQILATPAPEADLKYPLGVWHYARGMAMVAKNKLEKAELELGQLKEITAEPSLAEIKIWGFNSTASILNLASEVLAGKIAARQKDYPSAIAHLQKAVSLEDSLVYTEPADWSQPTRQLLGAILLQANRPLEAERVYREELNIYPNNGWSLYGLAQSLKAQKKLEEARVIEERLQQAWQYADVRLNSYF